ncbi:MAG TPA: hypothetical protein VEJ63_17585 [Planctomycetota bacterium]|nr:hypothetical protein [Planctomycetota bacterium]
MEEKPVDEQLQFYRRLHWAQRIGRGLMALIVIAAIIGVFGTGPISYARAGSAGAISAEYERFARRQAPMEVVYHVNAKAHSGETIDLHMPQNTLEHIDITSMVPAPDRERNHGSEVIYSFAKPADGELTIRVRYEFEGFGRVPFRLSLPSGEAVEFTTFVYP